MLSEKDFKKLFDYYIKQYKDSKLDIKIYHLLNDLNLEWIAKLINENILELPDDFIKDLLKLDNDEITLAIINNPKIKESILKEIVISMSDILLAKIIREITNNDFFEILYKIPDRYL